jgi:hypothetical protein
MKFKQEKVFRPEWHEIEKEITAFLKSKGVPMMEDYNIPCEEEMSNDSTYSSNVNPEVPSAYEMKDILKGQLGWKTGMILDWMCAEKVIPAGEYVVDISW